MSDKTYNLHGFRVFGCTSEGPQFKTDRDAVDLIAAASGEHAELVVIPTGRLTADFFHLKTRVAGEILQKFVTYQLRVVILGDISQHVSENSSLGDFVTECNRGSHIWFVRDREELEQRLKPKGEA